MERREFLAALGTAGSRFVHLSGFLLRLAAGAIRRSMLHYLSGLKQSPGRRPTLRNFSRAVCL